MRLLFYKDMKKYQTTNFYFFFFDFLFCILLHFECQQPVFRHNKALSATNNSNLLRQSLLRKYKITKIKYGCYLKYKKQQCE